MPSGKTTMASLVPDMMGTTICDGRIRFVELIGEGGYGVVYRAENVPLIPAPAKVKTKQFAVKVLIKAEPDTSHWVFQRRELAAHCKVTGHANVLTMHGYTEDDWFVYIVTDYCEGGDLFHAICDRNAFAGNTALVKKVFGQILDGVQACHEKGIFHRDLKPDNILLKNDEMDVAIADFGLATSTRMSETFGCGSSFYISPECLGREFKFKAYSTEKSDIWALGIILTNMIAGRNPWSLAITKDQNFLRYMANPDSYLREMLPISRGACALLQRIFTFDTDARITLPDLRAAILELDTFFMSEEDIAGGTKFVKLAAKTYADSARAARYSPITTADEECRRSILHAVLIEDRPEHYVVVSSFGTHESELSSGDESEGPITPATHAQDPAIEVPDFDEDEGLGVPVAEALPIQKNAPNPAISIQDVGQVETVNPV